MSTLPSGAAFTAPRCSILAFCQRAEQIVARSVEECREGRRTLAHKDSYPQIEAEMGELQALSRQALGRGSSALPPGEMEKRTERVLEACRVLLYRVPLCHKFGPTTMACQPDQGAAIREADDTGLNSLEAEARKAIECVRNVAAMLPEPQDGKADPESRVAALREGAEREYAGSVGTFWLAAFPAELKVGRCEEHDPACGTVVDGCVMLPWGGLHVLGTAGLGKPGAFALLAFSLLRRPGEEVDRFRPFAAEAGATLVASPPAWAQGIKPADAATTWVAALMFLAPAAPRYVVERPGGCLLITQPWAASLAALREWDAPAPEPEPPRDATGGRTKGEADNEAPQYVTLDQAAALVNRKKKTLLRALNQLGSKMPRPDVEGAGGKPHEWLWPRLRPWLEEEYGKKLPERFPSLRR